MKPSHIDVENRADEEEEMAALRLELMDETTQEGYMDWCLEVDAAADLEIEAEALAEIAA